MQLAQLVEMGIEQIKPELVEIEQKAGVGIGTFSEATPTLFGVGRFLEASRGPGITHPLAQVATIHKPFKSKKECRKMKNCGELYYRLFKAQSSSSDGFYFTIYPSEAHKACCLEFKLSWQQDSCMMFTLVCWFDADAAMSDTVEFDTNPLHKRGRQILDRNDLDNGLSTFLAYHDNSGDDIGTRQIDQTMLLIQDSQSLTTIHLAAKSNVDSRLLDARYWTGRMGDSEYSQTVLPTQKWLTLPHTKLLRADELKIIGSFTRNRNVL